VLLERRPSPGIWGGLWSFPELTGRDVAEDCRNLGYDVSAMRDLEAIEHGFTHFRLSIRPIMCEVRKITQRAEAPGRLWLEMEEARGAATPAPVKKLLEGLR
jgi:A/G-specific adenine glycosylase